MSTRLAPVALLLACASVANAEGRGSYHAPVTPAVVVGANEVAGGTLQPGWLLVVSALLVPGSDTTGAPVIAPRPEFSVRLVDVRGAAVQIAFAPLGAPGEIEESTQWFWLASESATQALTPGRYRIEADTSGFRARGLHAAGAVLVVEPAGSANDPRARRLRTEAALLAGRVDDALAETDRWTAADTADAAAWSASGDVLMELDRAGDALVAYQRAGVIVRQAEAGEPLDLARRTRAAMRRMLEQRGVLEPPPKDR